MTPTFKRYLAICQVICCLSIFYNTAGQIVDDFSDGNIDRDPRWISSNKSGNGVDFQVIDGELNSNGPPNSATLWVSTPGMNVDTTGQTTWQFTCRFSLAPSGSNNMRIYLLSDSADLSKATNAFYIRLGEGGSEDGIDLFRTGSSTPIIRDANATVAQGIDATIRVTRSGEGAWTLEASSPSNGPLELIGQVLEKGAVAGDHFGFLVQHTSTRRNEFFFDDVSVDFLDNLPPRVVEASALNENTLEITFSEPFDPSSAIDETNYSVSNNIGRPNSVRLDPADATKIQLVFGTGFASGLVNELNVSNIKDLAGNVLTNETREFLFFKEVTAARRDVIFTELMIDPSPPNDLPEAEFVEIFNNSDKVFDLSGWTLRDQRAMGTLNQKYFSPGEYLILCAVADVEEFAGFGQVLGLATFPTLNNDGDMLLLEDSAGRVMDSIRYDNSWFGGSPRTEGWTLELIDPTNECSEEENWAVTEDESGGTPGKQNSIFAEKPDLTGPVIVELVANDPDSIRITVNERLDRASILTANYDFNPGLDTEVAWIGDDLKEFILAPRPSLETGTLYELSVSDLLDCPGNPVQTFPLSFALVEPPVKNDILINEILFNPRGNDGHDFLEIYNNSNKYINLRKLAIGNLERDSLDQPQILNAQRVTPSHVAIPPGSYLALTTDKENIFNNYPRAPFDHIFEVAQLPSFPNSEGSVVLANEVGEVIDYFEYDEGYHFELLADREGVSLERIAKDAETNSAPNWLSAASKAGYATPGFLNSQSIENHSNTADEITVEPKVIIPDGDGHNDFATIRYQFDAPGKVANITIFDLHGREVVSLATNDVLPATGIYTWPGTNAEGAKVRTGYYIVYVEVLEADGSVSKFKEKVVVGSRF